MLFRNLGAGLSSDLIRSATAETYRLWVERYGSLPSVPLRTEVKVSAVRSRNPGYCYTCAGWTKGPTKRGKLHLYAPRPVGYEPRILDLFSVQGGQGMQT
jgi:hypothetical protein